MKIPIVYEDDHFLVVNKPSGLAVNRSNNEKGETLQDWSEAYLKIRSTKSEILNKSKIQNSNDKNSFEFRYSDFEFIKRAGIVHRLDKDTSGLLIIAKNPSVLLKLQHLFVSHEVIKKYYALVHGKVTSINGEIKLPVGRLPWNRRKFGVLPEGREAVTRFKVLEYYEGYSFLDVTPLTGRTHQIRIHFKSLGHSLVGDRLYAGDKVYEEDTTFCKRLFLQAYFLRFVHPVTEEKVEVEIELDKTLKEILSYLK